MQRALAAATGTERGRPVDLEVVRRTDEHLRAQRGGVVSRGGAVGQLGHADGRRRTVALDAAAHAGGERAAHQIGEDLDRERARCAAVVAGLFVAIPAVMAFNYFTGRVEAFDVEMDNSSSELIDYFIKQSHKR